MNKKIKIAFWVSTLIIFGFEGIMSALTYNSPLGQEGVTHLGYPVYFGTMLMVFKVIGSIVLIVPKTQNRFKEWAYAGFAIDFIAAFVSICVVDGFSMMALFPLALLVILGISYRSYRKLNGLNA